MVKGVWQDKCMFDNSSSKFFCSLDVNYIGRFAFCEQACPLAARRLSAKFNRKKQIHPFCLERKSNVIPLVPDATQIKVILDIHNNLRSSVGIPWSGVNATYPAAADLAMATWDYRIARIAQRYAEISFFDHNDFNRLLEHPHYCEIHLTINFKDFKDFSSFVWF